MLDALVVTDQPRAGDGAFVGGLPAPPGHRHRVLHRAAVDEPELVASAKAEQDQRYQNDAWDARIDRWLAFERRRVNHGYGSFDDWRDEEVERPAPLIDKFQLAKFWRALSVEPARWTKADQMRIGAYLKTRFWERYQARTGGFREWRYRKE